MYLKGEKKEMYNILVCDDDKEIVEAIEIYLSQEGYRILKAYDGEEVLKVMKSEKVDLLIIDVMMPKLDGIRTTLKIRENENMPIIILSAMPDSAYVYGKTWTSVLAIVIGLMLTLCFYAVLKAIIQMRLSTHKDSKFETYIKAVLFYQPTE